MQLQVFQPYFVQIVVYWFIDFIYFFKSPIDFLWDFFIFKIHIDMNDINISGYTCNTCGKIFETEEEFKNRHKKKVTIVKEKKD